jgi:16S rRNA C967 or C1407 C5-methylase (RsmB/RsmF family)
MNDTEIVCRNELVIRRVLKKLTREELVEVVDAWEDDDHLKRSQEKRVYQEYPKKELIDYVLRAKMVNFIIFSLYLIHLF